VSIDSDRYIDINPAQGWTGQIDVTVSVTDIPATRFDTFSLAVGGPTAVEIAFYARLSESGVVNLRWLVAPLTGIEGFNIYRTTDPAGPYEIVNRDVLPPVSPGEYADASVWPEATFWYELRAVRDTGVEELVGSQHPSVTIGGKLVTRLYDAAPNPFTTSTIVRFDVASDNANLRLAVYDVRGQLVRTLASGATPRGRHATFWNGSDEKGSQIAPGVYFVRLEVDGNAEVSRVLRIE
jgi:hypothetical protein